MADDTTTTRKDFPKLKIDWGTDADNRPVYLTFEPHGLIIRVVDGDGPTGIVAWLTLEELKRLQDWIGSYLQDQEKADGEE